MEIGSGMGSAQSLSDITHITLPNLVHVDPVSSTIIPCYDIVYIKK